MQTLAFPFQWIFSITDVLCHRADFHTTHLKRELFFSSHLWFLLLLLQLYLFLFFCSFQMAKRRRCLEKFSFLLVCRMRDRPRNFVDAIWILVKRFAQHILLYINDIEVGFIDVSSGGGKSTQVCICLNESTWKSTSHARPENLLLLFHFSSPIFFL